MFAETNSTINSTTDDTQQAYYIVYGVLGVITLIVVLDLWLVVDPRIPRNNPYYLLKTEAELQNEER